MWKLARRVGIFQIAMTRLLATWLLLLAVAFADEADDTRVAAAADHLRAGELKELLTKAGVEFGCASLPQTHPHGPSAMFALASHCRGRGAQGLQGEGGVDSACARERCARAAPRPRAG